MPNRQRPVEHASARMRPHERFPVEKHRKFAFSVEEIAESDYLYL